MHSAPSVSYPAGRSGLAAALYLCAWLLGAAAVGLWGLREPTSGWQFGGALALLLLVGLFASWGWWQCPIGQLAWDGESWRLSQSGRLIEEGKPEVVVDMQDALLLHWAGACDRWLWLERRSRSSAWADLRRALYSRANVRVPPQGGPAESTP